MFHGHVIGTPLGLDPGCIKCPVGAVSPCFTWKETQNHTTPAWTCRLVRIYIYIYSHHISLTRWVTNKTSFHLFWCNNSLPFLPLALIFLVLVTGWFKPHFCWLNPIKYKFFTYLLIIVVSRYIPNYSRFSEQIPSYSHNLPIIYPFDSFCISICPQSNAAGWKIHHKNTGFQS